MYLSLGKPKIARFTADNHIVKDHYYYYGNEPGWNRPAVMGPKFYSYFHLQNDLSKDRIENMKVEQVKSLRAAEQEKRVKILKLRAEDMERYGSRVRQRKVIQRKSNQLVLHADDIPNDEVTNKELCDIIGNRVSSYKYARSKEVSWNFLEKAPPKQIKQFLNPVMINGEVTMLNGVKKKLEAEDEEKEEQQRKRIQFRQKLRQNTLDRHEKTFEFEEKLETFSIRNARNMSKFNTSGTRSDLLSTLDLSKARLSLSIDPSIISINKELRLKFPNALSKIERRSLHSIEDKHSKLKSPTDNNLQRVLVVAQSELKGTLIKNMERGTYDSTNPFHRSLAHTSDVFKEVLEENLREKSPTSGSKILNSIKFEELRSYDYDGPLPLISDVDKKLSPKEKKRSISVAKLSPTKNTLLDEISVFERTFETTLKTRGYGRANLEETERLLNEFGIPGPQELLKKKEPVV